ncbi:NAD(P)H-binding protein [Nocardiopsis sp. CNT-189]|uniref:NAD(P)H-binding protein n=1 Tax=Nocardiopsis oceanisediminis TaxID=2816862 RepID=UPI003B2E0A7F
MILVTGATGKVGSRLVGLLAEGGHPVRALTRRPGAARFPAGVEVVGGDLADPGTLGPALRGATALHLITFAGDDQAPLEDAPRILAGAARAGVGRVTVLMGSVEPGPVERAVAGSGLEWTRIAPVEFMSNALEWAGSVRSEGVIREGAVDVPSSMVHEEDIAAVAAAALTEGGHAGATHVVTGPQALTVRDRARILGEVLGRPVRVDELSIEELRRGWRAEGYGEDDIAFFTAMTTERPEAGRTVLPTVRQVTGRPPRTFADWAGENAAAFR